MKRLTEYDEYGNADIIGVNSPDLQLHLECDEFNRVTDALNKLAAYEDMGIPAFFTVTCKKAIEKWGADTQTDMLIEEMSELTKALLKRRRKQNGRTDYDEPEKNDVAEEIADVIIMSVQQLIILDCYDDVDAIVGAKLRRLKSILQEAAE